MMSLSSMIAELSGGRDLRLKFFLGLLVLSYFAYTLVSPQGTLLL